MATNWTELKRTMPPPRGVNSIKCVVYLKDGDRMEIRNEQVIKRITIIEEEYKKTKSLRVAQIKLLQHDSRFVRYIIENALIFESSLEKNYEISPAYVNCTRLTWPEMVGLYEVAVHMGCNAVKVGIALVMDHYLKDKLPQYPQENTDYFNSQAHGRIYY